ncbi:MAG: hypothetical protein J5548_14275 [Prevotella sp.]|nr:hypothetical protein [Prevotella sp.]
MSEKPKKKNNIEDWKLKIGLKDLNDLKDLGHLKNESPPLVAINITTPKG